MPRRFMIVDHGPYDERSGKLDRESKRKLKHTRQVIERQVFRDELPDQATILTLGTKRHRKAAHIIAKAFGDAKVVELDSEIESEKLPQIDRPHIRAEVWKWLSKTPEDGVGHSAIVVVAGSRYIEELLKAQAQAGVSRLPQFSEISGNPEFNGRYASDGEPWEPEIGEVPSAMVFDAATQRLVDIETPNPVAR